MVKFDYEDYKGKRFGLLTVTGLGERNAKKEGCVKCICDCGTEKTVIAARLRDGHTKTCGCGNKFDFERDLMGERFGMMTVIDVIEDTSPLKIICKCDCGNTRTGTASNYKTGKIKSCGCYKPHKTHGESETPLYGVWCTMKQRCGNPKNDSYKDYGAKGVTVCEEWKNSYEKFRDWSLANGYKKGLEIDRILGEGNYEPSNCKWSTELEQIKNRSCAFKGTYRGSEVFVSDLCKEKGLSLRAIHLRVKRYGWTLDDAIDTPFRIVKANDRWKKRQPA